MSFKMPSNSGGYNNSTRHPATRDDGRKPIAGSWWTDQRVDHTPSGSTSGQGHFNDYSSVGTGRKRERSSRDPSRERDEDSHRHKSPNPQGTSTQPPSKRVKLEESPEVTATSPQLSATSDEFDELDFLASPASKQSSAEPQARPSPASDFKPEARKSALFDIGRAGLSAIKSFFPGSLDSTVSSPALQEALEAAGLAQIELESAQTELKKARDSAEIERRDLKVKIQVLQITEQKSQVELVRLRQMVESSQTERAEVMASSMLDAEATQAKIETLTRDTEVLSETANAYKSRAEDLVIERGHLNAQLKQMRNLVDSFPSYQAQVESLTTQVEGLKRQLSLADGRQNPPFRSSNITLDPFDNKVDQVSEADVKSGVESLNGSLDDFTMALLDEAEELARRHSDSRLPYPDQNDQPNIKLLPALAEYGEDEEKRGFLLDASIHHLVISELHRIFFTGDTLSPDMDHGFTGALLEEITTQQTWSAAQRWRALTASAGASLLQRDSSSFWGEAMERCDQSVAGLFSWVYCQPWETFRPLFPKIGAQVLSLFEEANRLSLLIRRDVLSVRMSVIIAPATSADYLPFDPECVSSVWPDMGVEAGDGVKAGDEVLTVYKFGLRRQTEDGRISHMLKPEVATRALLRQLAR
ncbi:hypothetical protein C8R46DRAFT_280815 [Mycena filopes]|nr:hypothetical protein C8R46DRAFT_280815 [Mycena filopes]